MTWGAIGSTARLIKTLIAAFEACSQPIALGCLAKAPGRSVINAPRWVFTLRLTAVFEMGATQWNRSVP
jgi:hypothetical protein